VLQYIKGRIDYVNDSIHESDKKCIDHLKMDKCTFFTLCIARTMGKLDDSKYVPLEEQIVLFFNMLVHHIKNRIVHGAFKGSRWTISEYFNKVLNGSMRLQSVLLKKPTSIQENSRDVQSNI